MDDRAVELLEEHEARALRHVRRRSQVARLLEKRRVRIPLDRARPLIKLLVACRQHDAERERGQIGGRAVKVVVAAGFVLADAGGVLCLCGLLLLLFAQPRVVPRGRACNVVDEEDALRLLVAALLPTHWQRDGRRILRIGQRL